ncbi:MAG: SapC family protein, partial [Proteobacteria bacterium]|nr:SapC family protein [Pseudomonadota bacterium]
MNDQNENVLNPLPPGYRSLVPFSREHFKGMGRRKGAGAGFMSELNSVLIMTPEFFQAARHYPIVFAKDFSGRFIPVGVTGFEEKQNLFVDADGYWRTDAYLPAYVRRWPFFTVQPESDPKKHFICVDKTGLEPSDEPFLDENGEPMVVYHGTTQGNTTTFRGPVWLAYEREIAVAYAEDSEAGDGTVVPLYAAIQNPLVLDTPEKVEA